MPLHPLLRSVPIWRSPTLYGTACALVIFIPGLALGSLRNAEILLLPRWFVEVVFPYSILPLERWLLLLLPVGNARFGKLDVSSFQPDVFTQQIFVAAFLSFFAVPLILTLQALAGATDFRLLQQRPSAIFRSLIVCGLARQMSAFTLLLRVPSPKLPTEYVVLPFVYFTAPLALILFTSMAGIGLWLLVAAVARYAFPPG